MRKYADKALEDFLRNKQFHSYKERDLMTQLTDYLKGKNDNKVMVLNGLRRTGKTTMMQQAIYNHIEINDAVYIRCQPTDKTDDITDEILKSRKKYIFLDEVTKVPDFIDLASSLSDDAAFAGHKIVMAGTDSLGFSFVKNDELFDRMHEIRTTFIPFSEHNRLTGKDLFQYMKYGGTLSDEDYFYNEDNLAEYTNSAIAHNILHTYKYWRQGEYENDLYPAATVDDIFSLVNCYVRDATKRFLVSAIEKFKASEFDSPAQIYEHKIRSGKRSGKTEQDEHIPDPEPLRDKKLASEWQAALQIKSEYPFEVTDKLIERIRENLIKLDVLTCIKDDDEYLYYFTQPGMRYCHIDAAIDTLTRNKKIIEEYSREDIDAVSQKIREDIEGQLIEDIIFLDLKNRFKKNKDISVTKYRRDNSEYDIAITNNNTNRSIVFEIKRSSQMAEGQKKHLKNIELQEAFERIFNTKIAGKAVLYSGQTQKDGEGFQYINSSDFLKNVDKNLNSLSPGFILITN